MIVFKGSRQRAVPQGKRENTEDSQKTNFKELDYRKRRTGVFFKPPCGADSKRVGIERQG